jgi:hypothetical protein
MCSSSACPDNCIAAGGPRLLLHEVQYKLIYKDTIFTNELTAKYPAKIKRDANSAHGEQRFFLI